MIAPLLEGAMGRMLVVAPHADDEVLGAGGLIARATQCGWQVHVRFAVISGFTSQVRGDGSVTDTRIREAEAALKTLRVASYEALHIGDDNHLRLDTLAQADLVRFVEAGVRAVRPTIAVIPSATHHHQDHRAFAQASLAALRPAPDGPNPFVPMVLAAGDTSSGWGVPGNRFAPSTFVDVSDVIGLKLEALAAYESQLCPPPHPRSIEGVRAQCAAWGSLVGTAYAEAFETLRCVF